ncbi:MAG: universal stress protein, partial [Ktedonobacterales bacterium]
LDLAGSHPGSLIVMSTRGRSGFTRFLLGSVAFEVLHRTHVPLLIVPSHQDAFAPESQIATEHVFAPDSSLGLGNAKPILADVDGHTLD